MATASPFFLASDLRRSGVTLRVPTVAFAHPLDGGRAAAVTGGVAQTAAALGEDGAAYQRLFGPLVRDAEVVVPAVLAPFPGPLRSAFTHPTALAGFGRYGAQPAAWLARRFRTPEARALFAGVAAHAMLPLSAPLTAGYGLLLTMLAHTGGWPVAEGGSGRIAAALVAELRSLGGRVITGQRVRALGDLPQPPVTLLDVSPKELLRIAGGALPQWRRETLAWFRYHAGVCKVDWALSGPVPWQAPACRAAGTVHVGGTFSEIAQAAADVAAGRHPARPFCIVAQPCVADPSRAPAGRHTLWGYCHVPAGSRLDMTGRIEAQIERFAPGFRRLVLARATRTAAQMEQYNPNYVGGDINGGAPTLRQTLFRPIPALNPYRTGIRGVYLCSASTPPGGGVHGMCGVGAARAALADLRRWS